MQMSHILLNNAGIESVPKSAFYKGSNEWVVIPALKIKSSTFSDSTYE